MMVQIGASYTDWMLSATSFLAALAIYSKTPRNGLPGWCSAVFWTYVSLGFSSFAGGFMWGWGVNLKPSTEMSSVEKLVVTVMVGGMAGEAFGLLWAALLMLGGKVAERAAQLQGFAVAGWLLTVAFTAVCVFTDIPGSWSLQPCVLLGIAFPTLFYAAWQQEAISIEQAQGLRRVLQGTVLNLCAAVALTSFDSACTGPACITGPLPGFPEPCLWNPKGEACPLPESFNHAALMHCFAIPGCAVTTLGMCGLLTAGWSPKKAKGS